MLVEWSPKQIVLKALQELAWLQLAQEIGRVLDVGGFPIRQIRNVTLDLALKENHGLLALCTGHTHPLTYLRPAVVVLDLGGESYGTHEGRILLTILSQHQLPITATEVLWAAHEEHFPSPRGCPLLLPLPSLLGQVAGEGAHGVPTSALLSSGAADAQLGPVEVSEGGDAELGGEPGGVQVQGWGGMLNHHPIQSTQPLGAAHVFGVIVLIIGDVKHVLAGLIAHLSSFRASLASTCAIATCFL